MPAWTLPMLRRNIPTAFRKKVIGQIGQQLKRFRQSLGRLPKNNLILIQSLSALAQPIRETGVFRLRLDLHIGLDVHDGTAVFRLQGLDPQDIAPALQEAHGGDQNRVGPGRTAGGENSFFRQILAPHGTHLSQVAAFRGQMVRPVQHHDMGKFLDALQQVFQAGIDDQLGDQVLEPFLFGPDFRQPFLQLLLRSLFPRPLMLEFIADHADGAQNHFQGGVDWFHSRDSF